MDQYTDDERVEDLKKWWKDNGASIIGGIVLGLIVIFGWQYWNSHRIAQAEAASQKYQQFIDVADKPDIDQAREQGQVFLNDFPNSSYAVLVALRLSRLAMDRGDTTAASQQLEWVISNAKIDEIQDIARLRLAQILASTGQAEEAKKTLERITTASLLVERDELRGDLYLAANERTQAQNAYTAALAAGGGNNPLLQLKLDNLAPPTAESVVAAPAGPPPAAAPKSPATAEKPAPAATESSTAEPKSPATAEKPAPAVAEPAASAEPTSQPIEAAAPTESTAQPTKATVPAESAPQSAESSAAAQPAPQPTASETSTKPVSGMEKAAASAQSTVPDRKSVV